MERTLNESSKGAEFVWAWLVELEELEEPRTSVELDWKLMMLVSPAVISMVSSKKSWNPSTWLTMEPAFYTWHDDVSNCSSSRVVWSTFHT